MRISTMLGATMIAGAPDLGAEDPARRPASRDRRPAPRLRRIPRLRGTRGRSGPGHEQPVRTRGQ